MSAAALKRLDIPAFLAFAEGRGGGWELHDGQAVARTPERILHTTTKTRVVIALDRALEYAGKRCVALTDGATVRIADDRAFVPDALAICPPPPPDAILIDNPVIVVEVLSPSSVAIDHGIKVQGYFSLPSLAHYLILDADRRVVIHHGRDGGDRIVTRFVTEGSLTLEPPGIALRVADVFGPAGEGAV